LLSLKFRRIACKQKCAAHEAKCAQAARSCAQRGGGAGCHKWVMASFAARILGGAGYAVFPSLPLEKCEGDGAHSISGLPEIEHV
jgi:hypothetical protein